MLAGIFCAVLCGLPAGAGDAGRSAGRCRTVGCGACPCSLAAAAAGWRGGRGAPGAGRPRAGHSAVLCGLLQAAGKALPAPHDGPEGYGPHGIPCAKSSPRQPAAGSAAPGTAASGVQLGLYAQQRHGHAGPAGAGRRVPVEGRPLCPVCAGLAGRGPGAGVLCRVCGVGSQLPDHALRLAGRPDGLAPAKPAHPVLAGPVCQAGTASTADRRPGGIVPCVHAGGGADAAGVFLPDPAGSRAVRAAQCGNGSCTGACVAQPALDE